MGEVSHRANLQHREDLKIERVYVSLDIIYRPESI